MIVDPDALRLELIYDLLDIAYRTRNRRLESRKSVLLRHEVGQLLLQDLRHVAGLRLPTLTCTVLRSGLRIARLLQRRSLPVEQLERFIRNITVRSRHRRRHPRRPIRIPVVDALGLAKDIDTEEEARSLGTRS